MGQTMKLERSNIAFVRNFARELKAGTDGLPPPRCRHWVARDKQAVVNAVNSGRLPLRDAMQRYELSIEEFETWQKAYGVQEDRRLIEPAPRSLRELRFGRDPGVERETEVERKRELERLS